MNQNYNFVRALFSQVPNARNEEFATKKGTSFKSLLLLVVFAFFASISMQGQTYFTESFEGAWYLNGNSSTAASAAGPNAPSGWTQTRVVNDVVSAGSATSGAHDWAQSIYNSGYLSDTPPLLAQAPYGGSPGAAPAGTGVLWFFDGGTSTGNTRRMASPAINLSASTNPILTFSYSFAQNSTSLFVVGSLDGGLTWNTLATLASTSTSVFAYSNASIILPSAYKIAGAKIGFQKASSWGSYDVFIDNVIVREGVSADAAPINFTASTVTFNATTIGWTDNSTNETAFRLYRSTDNINFVQIGADIPSTTTVGIGTTYSSVQALSPGTTYYYKIASFFELESVYLTGSQATISGTTYYWVGSTGGLISTPTNWNTMADGTGSTRAVSATTDILIVDGDGFVAGGTTTINVDAASFSIGQLIVNNNTALTLQSSATTLRTITITGGPLDDFLVTAGSTLTLNHALNPVAFAFSGTANTGNISGTVNLLGSTSNVITTTGGTGTLFTVTGTGVVNMGNTAISLVGTTATLSFLNGSNCNVSGATTGAPPVPLATWETNSNLTISGITTSTTSATNKTQSFGNFIYNCPLATATMSFFTTATTAVIKGNLIIAAAGSASGLGIFRALTTGTLVVNGDVIVTQGRFQSASGTGTLIVNGNTSIATNGIIDINAGTYSQRGTTFTNNGTLTGVLSTATLQFYSPTNLAQTFAGTGAVLTNVGVLTLQNTSGLTISHTNQVSVLRANLFQGLVTNSNKLTFGTGLALATTVQIGSAGLLTPGGSFDTSPTFNLGTGTHGVIYAQESVARTTGFEIPSTRSLGSLTVSNSNGLTVSGGALATGTLTFSALTGGNINTTSTNLLTVTGTATTSIVRTLATAYVNGPLALTLPVSLATGSSYTFPIGKGTLNPFVLVNPMTGATVGATVTVKAEVFDAATGGTLGTFMGTLNTNRYWAASITAGSSNFTDTLIQLNDTTNGADAIAASTTLGGAYSLVGGVTTTTTATSLTSTAPKSTTLPGYFVMGNKSAATLTNLAITPIGNACANVLRTVTVTATPGGGAVTGVVINYSINGATPTTIAMTNTSGNNWSGIIPTVTPANATITWSVSATDVNFITKTAIGIPYSDEPTLGVTASATASLASVCSGNPTNLSMVLTRPAVTLGTGLLLTGATTQPTAFCNRWSGYRSQTVYTASELIASGLSAGSITSMAYNITTLGDGATNAGFTVKIGATTLSALTTTFEATTSFTTVYPSQTYTHTASGQQVINFSTPYIWDGTSNIIIEVMHSGANSTNNAITYYTSTTGNTVLTATSTTATTGTQSTQRLNLILQFNPIASAYSWSDGTSVVGTTNALTVNPTATTTYTGTATIGGCLIVANTVTVNTLPLPTAPTAVSTTQCGSIVPLAAVTATSGAAGTGTFKWYAAVTGGVALQTSASTTYTTPVFSTTTFYVSEVGVNACESARTPVTITVLSPPVLTLSASPQAICEGTSTLVPVTITSTLSDYNAYSWTPTTGVTGTSGTGFIFNPTTTTTYVLSGTNSVTTCATTANLVVTVNPLPLITSATSSSEPLCLGSSTTLTAVSIPAVTGTAAVGAGATTSATYSNPFYSLWSNIHTQHLITATELSAMGIVAGNITSVALNVTSAGTLPMLDLSVKIGSATAISMTTFAPNSSFQTVFTSASFLPIVGVNTLSFTTPFVWDGTSNIVLEFCHGNAASSATMSRTVSADVTSYVSTVKSHISASTAATAICGDTATNLASYSLRPKFIFGGQVGTNLTSTANWTWSPSTALSTTTGNVVIANPTVSTVYTVSAVNPITTCTASRTVSVTVLPLPSAPTTTNATQCGAQLSAASVTSTTGLTTPIFVWYAAQTGGVALQTGTSNTYTNPITATTTLYVTEYNGSCESIRVPVVMTVTTPPSIAITSTVPSFCGTGGATALTASSADTGMTYSWTSLTPSATLTASIGASVSATLSETSNFMVIGTAADVSCLPITSYVSIGVYSLPSATVTTDASGVCPGTSANISSGLFAGNFAVSSIPYAATEAPLTSSSIMKNGLAIRPLSGGSMDDGGWSGIPIGFNFNYFGTNFSTISAGTNGLLMFGIPPGYGTGAGQLGQFGFTGPTYFPNTANPANIIALMATDMHMGTNTVDGSIKYWTEGYAPNRVFVIQYKNVNGYSANPSATVQCRLYETIGVVEIHIFNKTFSNNAIVGLQDATQTIGAVAPGRSGGVWTVTTPEAWRFTPPANYNTIWTATTVNGSSTLASGVNIFNQTVAPAITTTYSISYTNQTTGCANAAGSAQVLMAVLGNTIPAGLTTIASATSICTGQTVNFSTSYSGITDGMTFQWQSFDGTIWSDIALANAITYSTIPTAAAQYRCKMVACNGVPGYSSAVSIGFSNAIVTTSPGLRCGTGTAVLGATGSTGTTVNWYTTDTGGSSLGTGTTFVTPSITTNTTFYAGAETFTAGSMPIGLGGTLSSSTAQSFFPGFWGGAKTQYIIKASELIAAGIGAGNITSLGFEPTTSGQTYQGFSVSMAPTAASVMTTTFQTAGLSQVYLGTLADNGFIPVANTVNNLAFGTGTGSATSFNWNGSSNILVSISWSTVPASGTAAGTIMKVDNVGFVSSAYDQADNLTPAEMLASTTADGTGSLRPRFTINGQVVCSSPRVAVLATVTAPPAITLSGNPATICSEQSSAAVTVVTGRSDYDTYVWTPSASVTGNATTGWVFNPLTTTDYTLAVSQSTGVTPCATTTGISVTVIPTPSVLTISPTTGSVCIDTVLPLVSSGGTLENMPLLNQNFNSANTWTTVNNSTGGTPSAADYTLQADGYSYGFGTIFHSNDNSQFYISNSDAQGSGSTTNTELKSPVFSTIGFSVANLSFYHFLSLPVSANVDYSINGGTTWVNIQSYTTGVGTSTGFVNANLPLPTGALNQPSVMIRFNYNASWGYYWAIDNVSISGTQVATMAWSPTTNLFSDPAATTPYTGGNVTTVYVKSSVGVPTINYTASATSALGCIRTATVPVTVYQTLAPTGLQFYQFCPTGGATVNNMSATLIGTAIKWYSVPSGGTQLASTTALAQGYYWASQTVNGCESPTRFAVFAISNATAAPSSNPLQQFCISATVASLTANGSGLQWYAASTGGVALASTASIATGTYYVSQTSGGCESPRTAVAVIVTVVPNPTATAQTFCNSGTVAGLTAIGSGLNWYSASTGGATLASTTALASGTYYVSQTINGCEGSRTSVVVTINTTLAPTATAQTFCNSGTVAALIATGTDLNWYASLTGGAALANTTALATGTYYVSQTINACEGPRTAVSVTLNTTTAPNAAATQTFCNSATVAALTATGTGLNWYATATGGTALTSTTALTTGTTYYVSQTISGCQGPRTAVSVIINSTPAPTGAATQSLSSLLTVGNIVVAGTNVVWYSSSANAASGTNPLPNSTLLANTTYYATQTIAGCSSTTSLAVTITTLASQDFDMTKFSYYPNPVIDLLNVSYSQDMTNIKVFNMIGQQLLNKDVNATSTQIDMSSYSNGAYFIQVSTENAMKTVRVIKK